MADYTLEEAFPVADPGVQPFGSRVLVQIRNPKRKTASGIILTADTQATEHDNTQVAKVIAVGPLAYKNRNTMENWPEGEWCRPGYFVRVPKYGGDRWNIDLGDGNIARYVIFNDLDILGGITVDPRDIKAFI